MCIDAWTNIIILSVYSTIQIVVAQSIYGLDQYYLHRRVQGRKARQLALFACELCIIGERSTYKY